MHARKLWAGIPVLGILIIFLVFSFPRSERPSAGGRVPAVLMRGVEIPVEVANDIASRAKGLSGRASLPENAGMLFTFPEPGLHQFWMPDMRFPIDIIWIESGIVVGISPDAQPETDPLYPRRYSPPEPVRYVLEVNAGFARTRGILTGAPVVFQNIGP